MDIFCALQGPRIHLEDTWRRVSFTPNLRNMPQVSGSNDHLFLFTALLFGSFGGDCFNWSTSVGCSYELRWSPAIGGLLILEGRPRKLELSVVMPLCGFFGWRKNPRNMWALNIQFGTLFWVFWAAGQSLPLSIYAFFWFYLCHLGPILFMRSTLTYSLSSSFSEFLFLHWVKNYFKSANTCLISGSKKSCSHQSQCNGSFAIVVTNCSSGEPLIFIEVALLKNVAEQIQVIFLF